MKMASKNEVVRITFKELHDIVEHSSREDEASKSTEKHKHDTHDKKFSVRRRPPIQIYQPGLSRLSRNKTSKDITNQDRKNNVGEGENWDLDIEPVDTLASDDSARASKESSADPEVNGISAATAEAANQNGSPRNESMEAGDHWGHRRSHRKTDNRKRGKRPDIQIYVPKGRLIGEVPQGDGGNSPDSVSQAEYESESPYSTLGRGSDHGAPTQRRDSDVTSPTSPFPPSPRSPRSPSQRKIDVQFGAQNMQVTVLNDQDTQEARQSEPHREHVRENAKGSLARERAKDRQELLSTLRAAHAKSESLDSPELQRRFNRPSKLSLSRQNSLADTQSENENCPDTNGSDTKEGGYKSKGSRGGKRGGKRHSFSAMRRQRTGSFSSDVSASSHGSFGSDVSLEEEFEMEPKTLDWVQDVEEELAKQVQDEAQRLNTYLENCVAGYPPDVADPPPIAHPAHPKPKEQRPHDRRTPAKDVIKTQEYRGRRKDRRRKPSVTESRESSTHSNYQEEEWAPRVRPQRRQRKRHSSAGSKGNRSDNFSDAGGEGSHSNTNSLNRRQHNSQGTNGKEGKKLYDRRHNSHELDLGSKREGFRRGRHDSYGESPRDTIKITLDRNQRQVKVSGFSGDQGRHSGDRDQGRHSGDRDQGRHSGDQGRYSSEQGRHSGDQGRHSGDQGRHSGDRDQGRHSGDQGRYSSEQGRHSGDQGRHSGDQSRRSADQGRHSGDQGRHSVDQGRHSGDRDQGRHSGDQGRRSSDRDQGRHEPSKSAPQHLHPGGLLRLPGHPAKQPEYHHDDPEQVTSHLHKHQDPEQGRKMLFDPRNPNKPIVITNSKSKGHERDIASSPQDPAPSTSPASLPHAQSHPHGQPFYPDYRQHGSSYPYPEMPYPGPGFAGMPPPPPPPHPAMFGYPQFPFKECGLYVDDTYTRDPYYHGGYDPDQIIGGRSRSQCRAMAEQLLRDTQPLDNQLSNLLSRRINGEDGWRRILKLRDELRCRYEQIMFLDADVSNKHGVEQLLWKSVYYQVIEVFRHQLGEDGEEDVKGRLHTVLDEGTEFFQNLLVKLQTTYSFNIDMFLDVAHPAGDNISRPVKLALLSAQRTYIFLGDIARYREQANETANYGRARNWYMKAQQIAPKNGRPYNQLAILAMYTRRKLDAVYFYLRSLAASNPFLTARESLMSVFEEVRKKAEAADMKRLAERERLAKLKRNQWKEGPRVEIWVSHDGRSVEDEVEDGNEEDLTCLPAIELNKRFVLSFLNVHGKLFTKTGMEMFAESSCLMLREFDALLQHSPVVVSSNRLLQLMAINMFAVENTALKDESLGTTYRSLVQEHAVQLALDMFGLLVCQCSRLLTSHLASHDYPAQLLNEDLHQLIPGVKVWSDWMMCHPAMWNPPPTLRSPDLGLEIDVWKGMSDLCNVLTSLDTTHVKIYRDRKEGCDPIVLSEDTMMAGFIPMLSALVESCYVHTTTDKEVSKDCLRLEKLRLFGEYLCGIEPPMLSYNVETKRYFSVAVSNSVTEVTQVKDRRGSISSESDDVIVEGEDEADVESGGEDHVRHLKARKHELQRKKAEHTRHKENAQAIVNENRHRRIELEIHPIFLIPDTNCFIDHLPALKRILYCNKYTLVIPLVVINELDGLAKGSRQGHHESSEHAAIVKTRSSQSVAFLEEEFDKKNSHIRAQTSKGSILETISFRSEMTDATGNNDDLILSCCLHYCKDKARDFMPKTRDASVRLYRDVVLLTDDRNLRLKAHTSNVPVKDVASFKKWSNIT